MFSSLKWFVFNVCQQQYCGECVYTCAGCCRLSSVWSPQQAEQRVRSCLGEDWRKQLPVATAGSRLRAAWLMPDAEIFLEGKSILASGVIVSQTEIREWCRLNCVTSETCEVAIPKTGVIGGLRIRFPVASSYLPMKE